MSEYGWMESVSRCRAAVVVVFVALLGPRPASAQELAPELPVAGEPAPTAAPAPTPAEALAQHHVDEGFVEFRSGNAPAAIAAFQRALEIDPGNRRARFGLGTAFISTGEFAQARDLLLGLVKDYPDDYAVKNNLAWLFATAGDLRVRDAKQALAFAQEAVLMAPQDFHVWSTLAEAYYIGEKYEQALRAATEALRLVREQTRDENVHKEYERQVEKCRLAVQAMSILE